MNSLIRFSYAVTTIVLLLSVLLACMVV